MRYKAIPSWMVCNRRVRIPENSHDVAEAISRYLNRGAYRFSDYNPNRQMYIVNRVWDWAVVDTEDGFDTSRR